MLKAVDSIKPKYIKHKDTWYEVSYRISKETLENYVKNRKKRSKKMEIIKTAIEILLIIVIYATFQYFDLIPKLIAGWQNLAVISGL